MTTATRFASLDNFEKGSVKRYLFSNMFDVAKAALCGLQARRH